MESHDDSGLRWLYVAALLSIVLGGSIDLALDRPRYWLTFHAIFELLMVAGALLMATTLWLGWWRASRAMEQMRAQLERRSEERDAWRRNARKALEGMAAAIDEQFRQWQLTPAEQEVALLLLKGRSHKAIAKATGRSDRTVRQHAASVYHKASLGGRAELAAYFLEGLTLKSPTEAAD